MLLYVQPFLFINLLVIFHDQDSYAANAEVSQADIDTFSPLTPLSPAKILLTSIGNLNYASIP